MRLGGAFANTWALMLFVVFMWCYCVMCTYSKWGCSRIIDSCYKGDDKEPEGLERCCGSMLQCLGKVVGVRSATKGIYKKFSNRVAPSLERQKTLAYTLGARETAIAKAADALLAPADATDASNDGTLSVTALKKLLLKEHTAVMNETEVDQLFNLLDADGDGRLTRDELIYGLPQALAGSPSLTKMLDLPADQLAAAKAVDFSELSNASGKPIKIADTAERAVTLSQLSKIFGHAKKRVMKEKWVGDRRIGEAWTTIGPLLIADVNLYDTLKYVIKPATLKHKCSLVEMMAVARQLPDYFVSHWWGEAIAHFLECLLQHAADRKEDTQNTRYWVCAHANNQHDIESEIVEDVRQSAFFRAMTKPSTKGTVTVVDHGGITFSRIWCVFELYVSLVDLQVGDRNAVVDYEAGDVGVAVSQRYTYDMYTHKTHAFRPVLGYSQTRTSIGFTDGLAQNDQSRWFGVHHTAFGVSTRRKTMREMNFPMEVLLTGISFLCEEGEASVPKDKVAILAEINKTEGAAQILDDTLHGFVAASSLRSVIMSDDEELIDRVSTLVPMNT